MTTGDTRSDRAAVYCDALVTLRELDRLDATGLFKERRIAAHRELSLHTLSGAADGYEASLAPVTFSRCPHTGQVASLRIDVAGFDGPWWNHDVPRRPLPEGLPETMVGFDGSVHLGGAAPQVPYSVKLGPEVPTVVPRMFQGGGVVGVVSRLDIGPHTAWVTAYFAAPGTDAPAPLSDWGTDHYLGVAVDGGPEPVYSGFELRDPELRAWFESSRLRWIAPGDDSFELHSGVDGCPYLGLEGDADTRWLVDGRILSEPSEGNQGDRL